MALRITNEEALPAPAQPSLQHRVDIFEAQLICDAPAANVGDVRQTIAALSIPRKTFRFDRAL